MTKLVIDEKSLIKRAQEYADKDEDMSALKLLNRCYSMEAKLFRAEILNEMGYNYLSANLIFEVWAGRRVWQEEEDITTMLSNSLDTQDFDGATMYGKQLSVEDDENELDEQLRDIANKIMSEEKDVYRIVYPRNRKFYDEMLSTARDKISEMKVPEAIELLKDILSRDPDNFNAICSLCFCYIMINDNDNAKIYNAKSLQLMKDDDIFALSNAIMVAYADGEKATVAQLTERICSIKIVEYLDYYKIASTFCEIKQHKLAYTYLQKFCAECNPDVSVSVLFGISAINSGHYYEAKEIFLDIMVCDVESEVARYYLTIAQKAIKGDKIKPLQYTTTLPSAEIERRLQLVQSKVDFFGMFDNAELLRTVLWVYRVFDTDSIVFDLTSKIAEVDSIKVDRFFLKLLLDSVVSTRVKQKIFYYLLKRGKRGQICFCDRMRFYKIDLQGFQTPFCDDALCLAISKLITIGSLTTEVCNDLIYIAKNCSDILLETGLLNGLSSEALAYFLIDSSLLLGRAIADSVFPKMSVSLAMELDSLYAKIKV